MKVTFALFCLLIIQINAAPNIARPVAPIASSDIRSGNDAVVVSENSKPRSQPQPAPKLHVEHNQVESDHKPIEQQTVVQKVSEPEQKNVVQQKEEQLPIGALKHEEPRPVITEGIVPLIVPNIQTVEQVGQPIIQDPVQIQEQIVPIVPEVAPLIIAPIPPIAPIAQISPIVPIPIVPEPKSVSIDIPEQVIRPVLIQEEVKELQQAAIQNSEPVVLLMSQDASQVPQVKEPEPVVVEQKKEEKVVENIERKEEPKVSEPVVVETKKELPVEVPKLNIGELPQEVPKIEEQKPVVVVEEKIQEQQVIAKDEPKLVKDSELKKPLDSEQSQKGTDLQKQQPL